MAISLIYGPTKSGKTKRLVRAYILAGRYNLDTIIIKPHVLYEGYKSHEVSYSSVQVRQDIFVLGIDLIPLDKKYSFILVEDVHLFSIPEVHTILENLSPRSNNIVFYGLLKDFANQYFETTKYLLDRKRELLDNIEELTAKCSVCGKQVAKNTQRLINGIPAPITTPRIFLDEFVEHKPVCDECYVDPSKLVEDYSDARANV